MARTSDTRSRMVTSAALLIRETGVGGTSFARVLKHSDSPRGSISHHFPGGKTELVGDAISWAGDMSTDTMRAAADSGASAEQVFSQVTGFYRDALVDSDFKAGCPIGVAAQESYHDEDLRKTIKRIFDRWRGVLRERLIAEGRGKQESGQLAQLAVSSVEGALILARIDRSPEPLDSVLSQVSPLLRPASGQPGR